jgi:gas vesicle protein
MSEDRGFLYFFLGVGIGVAIGVLFAPKSGEETRGYLRDRAQEGKDYLSKQGESLRQGAEDLLERGKAAVQRQKDQLSAAVDAGKAAYREAVGGTQEAEGGAPSA